MKVNDTASQVFRTRMKQARASFPAANGKAGISLRQLEKRLAALGSHAAIGFRSLQRLESGDRKATIDEVLAISWVLGVAPVHMLVPFEEPPADAGELGLDARRFLHIGRGVDMHPVEAQAWIAGTSIRDKPKADYEGQLDRFQSKEAPAASDDRAEK